MKKVFLDDLPRWETKRNYGKINWELSAELNCKVPFIYEDIEGYLEIVDYKTKKDRRKYLTVKYKDREIEMLTGNLAKVYLGKLLGEVTSEFKIAIGTHYKDDKRDFIVIDRKHIRDKNGKNKKYYKYKCNICKYEGGEYYKNGEYKEGYWIEETHIANKSKPLQCSCCIGRIVVTDINSVSNTHPHFIKCYVNINDTNRYSKGSSKKILMKCPDCGTIKKTNLRDVIRFGHFPCSKCSDGFSYPNKLIYELLSQLKVEFISEYIPSWAKPRKYDFYFEFNDERYIIEAMGGQHFRDWKKGRTLKEEQENDKTKKQLALNSGIKPENYIEIDCDYKYKDNLSYMKDNILISRLNQIFNLNNIDWEKCGIFASKSRVKEICDLKRNNPKLSVTNIVNMTGLGRSTILGYLNQGNKLGFCNYDGKVEHYQNNVDNAKKISKKVFCYEIKKVFNSISECDRESEKLLGIRVSHNAITAVCNAKQKSTKGFHFKYIKDLTPEEKEKYGIVEENQNESTII